jgi:hypothetical protein
MKNLTEHLGEHQNYENHGRIRWTLGKFRKHLGTPIFRNVQETLGKKLGNYWKTEKIGAPIP